MKIETAGTLTFIMLWIVGAIVSLGIIGGVIWVAIHFLTKYW